MTDSCIICGSDAIELDDWYFCKKTQEFVCPWCVKDAHKITDMFQ